MIRSVLVVHKKSSRTRPAWSRRLAAHPMVRRDLQEYRRAQAAHRRALAQVLRALGETGLQLKMTHRARVLDCSRYDLIVSVGGDGTFLEAARCVGGRQLLLGVNSDPKRSAGSFCPANARNFRVKLRAALSGKARVGRLHRIEMRLNGRPLDCLVLNDILVTHRRPAAMSRYWLRVRKAGEEQRSSGLWIATAAGSTGAIRSAGGRVLPRSSRAIQYRPRELFTGVGLRSRLRGGVLPPGAGLEVGSLMRDGMVCADGEHRTYPLRYGDVLRARPSARPLSVIL